MSPETLACAAIIAAFTLFLLLLGAMSERAAKAMEEDD